MLQVEPVKAEFLERLQWIEIDRFADRDVNIREIAMAIQRTEEFAVVHIECRGTMTRNGEFNEWRDDHRAHIPPNLERLQLGEWQETR